MKRCWPLTCRVHGGLEIRDRIGKKSLPMAFLGLSTKKVRPSLAIRGVSFTFIEKSAFSILACSRLSMDRQTALYIIDYEQTKNPRLKGQKKLKTKGSLIT